MFHGEFYNMSQSKTPAKVKIGPHTFSIKWVEGLEECGNMIGQSLSITINNTIPASLARETLLHEIIHADFYLNGSLADKANEMEERIVQALGCGLLATLRENPEIVAYLLAK